MRYSRAFGPPVPYDLTGTWDLIPGCIITRWWDDGPVLILAQATVWNQAGASSQFSPAVYIDGVVINPPLNMVTTVPNNELDSWFWADLRPIALGMHTFELRAAGNVLPGDTIPANSAALIVCQLPLWDDRQGLPT